MTLTLVCVYGSLLRFTTSISYNSSASTLSPERKLILAWSFSAMEDINKHVQNKKSRSEKFERFWLQSEKWVSESGFEGVYLCLYGAYTAQGFCWLCAGQMLGKRGHINRHAPATPFKRQKEEEEEEAEVGRRGVKKKPQCLVKACSLTQSLSLSASQGAR